MARFDQISRLSAEAGAAFARLTARERNLLFLATAAVLGGALLLCGLSVSRAANLRLSRIESKTKQLGEVAQLTSGYAQAERDRADLERRLSGAHIRLFTMVEDLGKRLGVEVGGMSDKGSQPVGDGKISEQSVEVSLMRIDLDRLTKFLSEIEGGQGIVKVKRLQVRPRTDEKVIDAWLIVATYTVAS